MNNKSLKILFLYNGIFVFAGSLFGPLYAVYVGLLDSNILLVSITWSAFLIATVTFTFAISRFGDRVKEKEHLLMAGFLVRALAWFLFIFTGDIATLILLQILLGLGEALGTPAFDAIMAEHLGRGGHIRIYADWKLILNSMTGVGTLIGGVIAANYGFTWLFVAMSILAMAAFVGIALQPRKLL